MTMRATHPQLKATSFSFITRTTVPVTKQTVLIPKQNDTDFINFDLDRMKKAVEAKSHVVPNTLKNLDDFDAWLNQLPL
jgi:hypothetical protein